MRRLFPTFFALALAAGLAWLYRTGQKYDPAFRTQSLARTAALSEVSLRLGGATVVNRTEGRREWSVEVARIDVHRPAGGELDQLRSADFTGISRGVLYREGKPDAFFSARAANYDYFANRFDVRGGIRVRTARGDSLRSEQLQWSQRDDFLRFPAGASGAMQGHSFKAPWALYQPRARILDCPQGADGIFNGYPARAANLTWDVGKGMVEFRGPVSGERQGVTFSAASGRLNLKTRQLTANKVRMEFRIKGETPEVSQP